MTLESRVVLLEKKINLIAKALEIQSMEGVQVSEKTRREIRMRMADFLKNKRSNLIDFRDALNAL